MDKGYTKVETVKKSKGWWEVYRTSEWQWMTVRDKLYRELETLSDKDI